MAGTHILIVLSFLVAVAAVLVATTRRNLHQATVARTTAHWIATISEVRDQAASSR
jgi:hypothetical protein